MAMPTARAPAALTSWATWMMRFRSRRSAKAPPMSESARMGTAGAAETRPSSVSEPVISYARYPLASICIWTLAIIASIPSQR